MLYNFQIKFNASNENETFEPLEKLYTFYQQSLGSSSDVLSFSFWMAAAAEAAATSFSVSGSKLLLNAVVFSNITHYVPVFFSSTTFIIDETALFFVRRLYEFLRLWLGEFLPEGGEHVHQIPGVDAAVVVLDCRPVDRVPVSRDPDDKRCSTRFQKNLDLPDGQQWLTIGVLQYYGRRNSTLNESSVVQVLLYKVRHQVKLLNR